MRVLTSEDRKVNILVSEIAFLIKAKQTPSDAIIYIRIAFFSRNLVVSLNIPTVYRKQLEK